MAAQDADIKLIKELNVNFTVDGFSFTRSDCHHYFLTHYHSDHTVGLNAGFHAGIIYTSAITRNLLVNDMGVRPELVEVLPLNETVTIEGVEVTAMDAFHCPGAVMLHFYGPIRLTHSPKSESLPVGTKKTSFTSVLHVGDFRADVRVVHDPVLRTLLSKCKGLDVLYLDTTYCHPKYTFPPQRECLLNLYHTARSELERRPSTLFAVSAYAIGKEKAVVAIAMAAGGKVLVTQNRKRILKQCGYWDSVASLVVPSMKFCCRGDRLHDLDLPPYGVFTTDDTDPEIAVIVAKSTNHEGLKEVLSNLPEDQQKKFDTVVGFRATGWTHTKSKTNTNEFGLKKPWVQNSHDYLLNDGIGSDDFDYMDDYDIDDDGNVVQLAPLVSMLSTVTKKQDDEVFLDSLTSGDSLDEPAMQVKLNEGSSFSCTANANETTISSIVPSSSDGGKGLIVSGESIGNQNNIETRMYSVPYSEHSSFLELVNFVSAVKPRHIIPTVSDSGGVSGGGDGAKGRNLLVDTYFVNFMDLSTNKNKLDSYFKGNKKKDLATLKPSLSNPSPSSLSLSSFSSTSSSSSSLLNIKRSSLPSNLSTLSFFSPKRKAEVEQQHLYPATVPKSFKYSQNTTTAPDVNRRQEDFLPSYDPELLSQLKAIVGDIGVVPHYEGLDGIAKDRSHCSTKPNDDDDDVVVVETNTETETVHSNRKLQSSLLDQYIHRLMRDANGCIESAVAIHFGPNQGKISVPHAFQETEKAPQLIKKRELCEIKNSDAHLEMSKSGDDTGDVEDLANMCVIVYGADSTFLQFGSKSKAIDRLKQLGVTVHARRTIKTTHLLLGRGVTLSSVPHKLLHGAVERRATSVTMKSAKNESENSNVAPNNLSPFDSENASERSCLKILNEGWLLRTVKRKGVGAEPLNTVGSANDGVIEIISDDDDEGFEKVTQSVSKSIVDKSRRVDETGDENLGKKQPSSKQSSKKRKSTDTKRLPSSSEPLQEDVLLLNQSVSIAKGKTKQKKKNIESKESTSSGKKQKQKRQQTKVTIKQISQMAKLLSCDMILKSQVNLPNEDKDLSTASLPHDGFHDQKEATDNNCIWPRCQFVVVDDMDNEFKCLIQKFPSCSCFPEISKVCAATTTPISSEVAAPYFPCAHLAFVFTEVLGLDYRECTFIYRNELDRSELTCLIPALHLPSSSDG